MVNIDRILHHNYKRNTKYNKMKDRRRKSELMASGEHEAFKILFESFHTKVDAEEHFNVSRQVLDLVALKGSGSPETISKIRRKLRLAQKAELNAN